ncbi:MAG: hypothetical protein HYX86_02955 [Chloroflexi bacterium]|nr:hypothetical protein [Chloroflexota bacterium]
MIGQGRLTGILLILGGIALGSVCSLWLVGNVGSGQLQFTGFILGLAGILILLVLPLIGAGVYLFIRGGQEVKEFAEVEKEQKLLNMVQTQGKARVQDLALSLNLTRDQVRDYIYDLVGKGLFIGYINWQDGILYAKEATQMQTTKCPNCGGVREMVGKGVVKCPYCGSELFIP